MIDLADRAPKELDAIAVLADACGGRRTTAARMRARIDEVPWLHRRTWLGAILDDVAAGTCSVLEHRYLTHVERPHGLPRGDRQDPIVSGRGRMWRDVIYRGQRPPWTQLIELDGRLGHESTRDRDLDFERDLDAALEHEHTSRLGYGQVFDRPCWTAFKVDRLLWMRGWRGRFDLCPACPPALRSEVERPA